MWSPAVVANLPQNLTSCASSDAFLLIVFTQSGYLSYHSRPISFNHSGHCPLMPFINSAFPGPELTFFFFFATFCVLCVPNKVHDLVEQQI